ncbi:MAG: hypothetical protein KatS3mg118_1962 [Paracoccaceae bacterium]|nr:MAG: hypothetical protein D6686_05590 [Alphaproteobacteria bacterium]GIX14003.1 MAG: hypothetical protein KatS3mg118_1962 [Paracoccaceae bacterium]
MQILLVAGLILAATGLAGLGRCILVARRLRAGKLPEDALRARLQGLVTLNLASVSTGFLGAALVAVALILG